MEIFCENPTLIFNEKFKWCLLSHRCYYRDERLITLPSSVIEKYYYKFPYCIFTKKYCRADKQLDFVYTVDDFGEKVPAYIQVPCGICCLCRNKNTKDWRIRAVAETQTSPTPPIFVTLTYKDMPEFGVSKEELQKFFKRLRISLDRKGISHQLRYFACGEYGKLTGRPHYHVIFWNWPLDEDAARCGIPLSIQADRLIRPVWDKGFICTRQSDYGSISYIMKYMRKGIQSPSGLNPGFFLSSRKNGGLGAEWLRQNINYFRENPHVLTMTVTDKFTGRSFEAFLPRYYKDKIFPPHSKAIPRKITEALNILNCACLYRRALEQARLKMSVEQYLYADAALDILYPIYPPAQMAIFDKFRNVYRFHQFVRVPTSMVFGILSQKVVSIEDLIEQTDKIVLIITDFLQEFCFDDENFVYLQNQKMMQMDRFNLLFQDRVVSQEEITYAAEHIRRSIREDYLKELI